MDDFATFWAAYPRKVGKGAAEKAFHKVKASLPMLLAALEWQAKEWRDPKFIPHASTWLHQRRWEDEPFHTPAAVTADKSWFAECARLHGSSCGNRYAHAALMARFDLTEGI